MGDRTGGFYGINEALLSSLFGAIIFSMFAAQPLTIVGITGLISLFNYTIYDIIQIYDITLFPAFMVWVSIWAAIFHWLVAICNLCDYMRFVTDFSSQSFGYYVSIVYIIKGVELLTVEFVKYGPLDGFMSTLVGVLYFATVYALETIGRGTLFKPWIRGIIGDYAYPVSTWLRLLQRRRLMLEQIATIFWTGFSHIPDTLANVKIATLDHTPAFYPTVNRPWVVAFWELPVSWVFVALPIGFLLMLLFYYDHNVSSIAAQARHFPLKKPGGFHWDFFLMGCTCFGAGVLNIPLPNGLVPQAPVHTDAVTVYDTELDECVLQSGAALNHPKVVAREVKEQRLSSFVMGLAFLGTMTGPLLIVLHTIPRGLFAGVFFVVGWAGIEGSGITEKLVYILKETRFIRSDELLLKVRTKKILLYLLFQGLGIATTVAISQTIAAIGFPVLIIALIPLRWLYLPHLFTAEELRILDAPTATGEVVLASLGGRPEMPEDRREREKNGVSPADTEATETAEEAMQDQKANGDGGLNNKRLDSNSHRSGGSVHTSGSHISTRNGFKTQA